MVMLLFETPLTAVQFGLVRLSLLSRMKPAGAPGKAMVTVVPDKLAVSLGPPGVTPPQ